MGMRWFFDEYEWQSEKIPPILSPVDTCHRFGNSTVLLAGHSIMKQILPTIRNSLSDVGHVLSHGLV